MNNFWFQQHLRDPLKYFFQFLLQCLLDLGANMAAVHSGRAGNWQLIVK